MSIEGFVNTAGKEVVQTGKNILSPLKYDRSKGLHANISNAVGGTLSKVAVEEPLRLTTRAIGGIAGWTWGRIAALIGGTARLAGKAVLQAPVIPTATAR
ncbi:MAG: hypothetical protein PHW10_01370 [Candidatus Peribacteraceae bacterium]|nr:hypothetical protein [Candidatus Peribacteraceae bacterium]